MELKNNKSKNLKFEFFDVTADIGFKAYGKSLDNAFENAGLAMFNVITDTSQIKPSTKKEIEIISEDKYALLFDWLTELLILHDSEYLVFSKFNVKIKKGEKGKVHLTAQIWGDEFDPNIHEVKNEVKAVTYHLMEIKKNKKYLLQVILDI
ncbi:MAG: archease [Methanomicrobiales archaeon]